jgi:hypothetical protein
VAEIAKDRRLSLGLRHSQSRSRDRAL